IAEIITNHGLINLDFNDVKTVLKDGGVAIMSTGYGEGDGRVKLAIQDALNSPLLNDNDIFNSKKILLSINFSNGSDKENQSAGGLMMEEMNEVNDFMEQFGSDFEIKWGIGLDPDLGNKVKVTILATGFGIRDVDGMDSHIKKIVKEADDKATETEIEQGIRIGKYYPDGNGGTVYKRRPQIFHFRQEDLDNEEVILAVENTPTYKRTSQQVKELQLRVSDERKQVKQQPEEEVVRTIKF
ncbi:MAG: cell division protein FtsZ, partial [Prevotella sp.]|nr:cell division protein FtsZ [Prevotella sp.]